MRAQARMSWFFFFNDTATTEIYTLSLHDALPILHRFAEGQARRGALPRSARQSVSRLRRDADGRPRRHQEQDRSGSRSEEHTSELQSRQYLVCRLLLEKKIHLPHVRRRLPSPTSA